MPALYVIAFLLALVLIAGVLAFVRAPALAWFAALAIWVAAGPALNIVSMAVATILAIVFVLPPLLLAIKPLRRVLISKRIFAMFRNMLPQMSSTERDAIEAGTVCGTPISSPVARIGTHCSHTARQSSRPKNSRSSITNARSFAICRTTGTPPPSGKTFRPKRGRTSRNMAFWA